MLDVAQTVGDVAGNIFFLAFDMFDDFAKQSVQFFYGTLSWVFLAILIVSAFMSFLLFRQRLFVSACIAATCFEILMSFSDFFYYFWLENELQNCALFFNKEELLGIGHVFLFQHAVRCLSSFVHFQ